MDAKRYALQLLNKRGYTEAGLRRKLEGRKFAPKEIEQTLSFCRSCNFINDLEFAKSFIRGRDRARPRGAQVLRWELIKKGVAGEVVDRALAESTLAGRDEKDLARELVERKRNQYANLSPPKAKQRLFALLMRRGFKQDIIREVLGKLGMTE